MHHDIAYGKSGNSKDEKHSEDIHMVEEIDNISYGGSTWMTLVTRVIIITRKNIRR